MLKEVNHDHDQAPLLIQPSISNDSNFIHKCPKLNTDVQSDESKTKASNSAPDHHKDLDLDEINSINNEWSSMLIENNLNIDNITFPEVYDQDSNEMMPEIMMEHLSNEANLYLKHSQDDTYNLFQQESIRQTNDQDNVNRSDKEECQDGHSTQLDHYSMDAMDGETVTKTEIIDNKPQNSSNTSFTTTTTNILNHPVNYNVSPKRRNIKRHNSSDINSFNIENKNEEKKENDILLDDQMDENGIGNDVSNDKNVEYYQMDNAMLMNGYMTAGIAATTAYNPQSIIIIPHNYEFSQNIIKEEFINASNNILEPCLFQDYMQYESAEGIARGYNFGIPVYSTFDNQMQMQYNISNDLGTSNYNMQLNSSIQNNTSTHNTNTIIGINNEEGTNVIEEKIYTTSTNTTTSVGAGHHHHHHIHYCPMTEHQYVKATSNVLQQEHMVMETKKRKRNKKRENLPKEATAILKKWLLSHMLLPYPGIEEKILLCKATQLTLNQVNNWFINARVRIWKPVVTNLFFKYENHLRELELDDQNKNQLKRIQEYSKISTMNMVSLLSGLSEARKELDEISKDLVANIKKY